MPKTNSSAVSFVAFKRLEGGKNLLAFSAGPDSTALFFLLLERSIPFDIAIVDYGLRAQAKEEVAYARELAERYGKRLFLHTARIQGSHFEERARKERYRFFEQIIKKEGYDTLITAHTLDDAFEWLLMRLAQGAGAAELVGMEPVSEREGYTLVRPLLLMQKRELLDYLKTRKIRYFLDATNESDAHFRNRIRKKYAKSFMDEFGEGVKRSFGYLLKDKSRLEPTVRRHEDLIAAFIRAGDAARALDRAAKALGYLLSEAQKEELLRQKGGVAGGVVAFAIEDGVVFAAPYRKMSIPKEVRERYRKAGVPKLLRGYFYSEKIDPALVAHLTAAARAKA